MPRLVAFVSLLAVAACATPNEPAELPANTPIGLRVWATVSPRVIRLRDSAAVLHLRIEARNPADSTVRIISGAPPFRFTPDPAESSGLQQSYRIASDSSALNGGPSADYWGDSVYTFLPHQASVVDVAVPLKFWREGGWPARPGVYRVRAYFNSREGAAATFQFVP
ncbi:MAG: hypothetical protein Q8K82_06335 [Gemmatimonadaceae bacterium]|nr:hypothetical protein [Gemmatimonadaceae bacterium]